MPAAAGAQPASYLRSRLAGRHPGSLDRAGAEVVQLYLFFKWIKTPDQIIDAICRYCDRISRPAH